MPVSQRSTRSEFPLTPKRQEPHCTRTHGTDSQATRMTKVSDPVCNLFIQALSGYVRVAVRAERRLSEQKRPSSGTHLMEDCQRTASPCGRDSTPCRESHINLPGNTCSSQSEPLTIIGHRLPHKGISDLSVLSFLSRANV